MYIGGKELRFESRVITVRQSCSNLHIRKIEIALLHHQIRLYISFAFVNTIR